MPIVKAVGSSVTSRYPRLQQALEDADVQAVLDAMAEGVGVDPPDMLARKAAARKAVLVAFGLATEDE